MSVALVMNVHDGVILAADSASTLVLGGGPGGQPANQQHPQVAKVYNNANKIANLYKGLPIGCVTFGSGSIGSASISTLLKDFRQKITDDGSSFNRDDYSMEGVARQLGDFLADESQKLPEGAARPTLGMFLGGYSTGSRLGERWTFSIENGQAGRPMRLHEPEQVGINWGGEGGEAIARLLLGFGGALPNVLQNVMKPAQAADQIIDVLVPHLQAPVVFAPMPIQDAIDLAEFLVHTAIQFSRFVPGPQVVGGPIEVAAITKHEGFKWIRRKHYYGVELNREIVHREDH
jgi:hypothetical protein